MGVFQLGKLLESGVTEAHHAVPILRSDYDAPAAVVHGQSPHNTSFIFHTWTTREKRNVEAQKAGWKPDANCHWQETTGKTCQVFDCPKKDNSECTEEDDGIFKCACKVGFCPTEVAGQKYKKCLQKSCAESAAAMSAKIDNLSKEIVSERKELGLDQDDTVADTMGGVERKAAGMLGSGAGPQDGGFQMGVHSSSAQLSPSQVRALEMDSTDYDMTALPGNGDFKPTLSIEDLIKQEKGTSVGEPGGGPSSVPLSTAVASITNEAGDGGLGKTVKQYSGAIANLMEATQNNFNTDRIALATAEDMPTILTPMVNMLTQVMRAGSFLRHKLASLSEAANMMDGRAIARGRARLKMGDSEAVVPGEAESAEVHEEAQREKMQAGVPVAANDEPLGSYSAEAGPDTANQQYFFRMVDQYTHPQYLPRGSTTQAAPDDMTIMYARALKRAMLEAEKKRGVGYAGGQRPGYPSDYGLAAPVPQDTGELVDMMTEDEMGAKSIKPQHQQMVDTPDHPGIPFGAVMLAMELKMLREVEQQFGTAGVVHASGMAETAIAELLASSFVSTHAATRHKKALCRFSCQTSTKELQQRSTASRAPGCRWRATPSHSALVKFL